jgi:predicted acetyltransferase
VAGRSTRSLDSIRAIVPAIADVELSPASRAERSVIASYLREYLAEFGFREAYPYFEQYWLEPTRHPFLIMRSRKRAGFAFVRSIDSGAAHEMSEFYVVPEHRGSGIGRAAVEALLPIFPGQWKIPVQISNRPGIAFWSRVLSAEAPKSDDGETVVFFHTVERVKRDAV